MRIRIIQFFWNIEFHYNILIFRTCTNPGKHWSYYSLRSKGKSSHNSRWGKFHLQIDIKLNILKNSVLYTACSHIAPHRYTKKMCMRLSGFCLLRKFSLECLHHTAQSSLYLFTLAQKVWKCFKLLFRNYKKVTICLPLLLLLLLGYVCECGLRAGFFEVVNMDPEVKSVLTASVAANLCPTVLGQVSEN